MASLSNEKIIEAISSKTLLEVSELVKMMEEKFGVSASSVAVAGVVPTAGAEAEAAEEKTEFTVVLSSFGDKKINVIKEVRVITGLGLKEAKDLVENAPKTIKEDVTKEESQKIKEQLEKAGAKVQVK